MFSHLYTYRLKGYIHNCTSSDTVVRVCIEILLHFIELLSTAKVHTHTQHIHRIQLIFHHHIEHCEYITDDACKRMSAKPRMQCGLCMHAVFDSI